jgi:hypothetical protein
VNKRQSQLGRARAAPAAHSCRLAASLSQVHARDRRPRPGRTTGCAAGPAWQRARRRRGSCTERSQRATTQPDGTRVRLAPPAPSRAAVGTCSPVFRRMFPLATTSYKRPAPWLPPDAQVREGPGAAKGSASSFFVYKCAALGPGAAPCSRTVVSCAHLCSDGRARSQTPTGTRGLPWSVWPDKPSRIAHKAGQESAENQGAQTLGSLPRCRVRSPAGGAGGKAPAGGAGAAPRSPPPATSRQPSTPTQRPSGPATQRPSDRSACRNSQTARHPSPGRPGFRPRAGSVLLLSGRARPAWSRR